MAKYLKAAEVAERLNISKRQVYKLISDGKLPSITIESSVRIPEQGLSEFLIERHQASQQNDSGRES